MFIEYYFIIIYKFYLKIFQIKSSVWFKKILWKKDDCRVKFYLLHLDACQVKQFQKTNFKFIYPKMFKQAKNDSL